MYFNKIIFLSDRVLQVLLFRYVRYYTIRMYISIDYITGNDINN